MKKLVLILLIGCAGTAFSQSIVGRWQLSEQKTCFQAEFKESETEKELTPSMGATSSTSVGKIMKFDDDGSGEEGIYSAGKKKGTSKSSFHYAVNDNELSILDKKSGLVTKLWVIDELTDTALKVHDAAKDCETKTFIRIK